MKKLLNMLKNNLGLKVAAVFFAVVLWMYVIAYENPYRERTISNVPITVLSQDKLTEKGLMVVGDTATVFQDISVRVSARISDSGQLTADNITATVDLAAISSAGTHRVYINHRSSLGNSLYSTPEYLDIEVDERISKTIPVVAVTKGKLAEGLFAQEPVIEPKKIEITGGRADVEKATRAICEIDLDAVTESVSHAYTLTVVDKDDNEIPSTRFVEKLPSATVSMTVLKTKTVPIDVSIESAIQDADRVANGYELGGVSCTPSEVKIAGTEEALALVNSIEIEPVNVRGSNASFETAATLILPEGIVSTAPTQEYKLKVEIVQAADESQALWFAPRS